jgi:hypothetical protein
MTAILSDLPADPSTDPGKPARASDPVQREMLALRARVRDLAEDRARSAAEQLTHELRELSRRTARVMKRACEDDTVRAGLHHRLVRQVNASLARARHDDPTSVEARASALLVAQLEASNDETPMLRRTSGAFFADSDLTPGATTALRALARYQDVVRRRFDEMKSAVQSELADLSLEMASETAARLCMRYEGKGRDWLCWRLARIVEHFVAVSTPATLPGALELLATRSVLSGLERCRDA